MTERENTDRDALKPCPFCGGEAKVADNTGPKNCSAAHAYVFCLKRGCPGSGDEQNTVAEAIAAWNTRPADRDALIAELVEALELAMDWIKAWDVGVLLDDEWPADEAKIAAVLAKASHIQKGGA